VSPAPVLDRIATLVALFNDGGLDVPDDLIARQCVFRLNGVAYEDTMGRPVSDPLVRLVARGPAAYRFLAQALRYAVPDARVEVEQLMAGGSTGGDLVTGRARVTGALRGGAAFTARANLALVIDARGRLTEIAAVVDEAPLAAIAKAREQ
jgi:hypothetical protein